MFHGQTINTTRKTYKAKLLVNRCMPSLLDGAFADLSKGKERASSV